MNSFTKQTYRLENRLMVTKGKGQGKGNTLGVWD